MTLKKREPNRPVRSAEPTAETAKEPKYMSIIHAQAQLSRALNGLNRLSDDIMQAEQGSDDKKVEEAEPSLLYVLNNTGGELTDIANNIISITIEIRDNIL